jgi:hypothetical protein
MKQFAKKLGEILEVIVVCLIPVAYIAAVIRTQCIVPETESGLPLVIGFVILPMTAVFAVCECVQCVKCLTNIGQDLSTTRGSSVYWSPAVGIISFIITLPFAVLLAWGSIVMFISVTGISGGGMLTY